LPQPAKQLISGKTDSGPAAPLRQSNIRNETLARPAFERSGRNFEKLRRLAVREDLFVTTCDAGDRWLIGGLHPLFNDWPAESAGALGLRCGE